MFGAQIFYLVALLVPYTVSAAKMPRTLPAKFPVCSRNDPKVNDCLVKATEIVRPFLKEGVAELRIPSIDPFVVPEIRLDQKRRSLDVKALLTNVNIFGLSNYKFSRFDFNPEKLEWSADLTVPTIKLNGHYSVNGTVVQVPVNGVGTFTAEVERCDVSYYERATLKKKNGLDYLDPQESKSSIQVSKPRVTLGGEIGGSTEINGIANKVIQDNIDILFDDLKPTLEEIISQLVKGTLFDTISVHVPYDNIYPPSV